MRPLIPRQLNLAYALLGWILSIAAISIGVAMWRHFTSIDPPPPTGVFVSAMLWIFCGLTGVFYCARTKPPPQNAMIESTKSLDSALLKLRSLQDQLDQNLIRLADYKAQRREILDSYQSPPDR